ncbi:centrosomal protein of 120 kDa [Ixodes scapularis]|uniref:centrosomal protein of 120 kDa n=1 Tax=Ixodes scapularis TaxID=6945 RepID=UPI001C380838|nr:centrosomal protein of 120 kDa [Ixodes scapularis]
MALCSRNAVVGETEVPLGDFTTESPQFSVSIEGLFQLRPVPADAEWLGSVQPEYRPIVGVHVEIREEPVHSEPRSELPERATASGPPDVPTSLANDNERTPPRARSRDRPAPSPTRTAHSTSPPQRRRNVEFSPPQKLDRQQNLPPSAPLGGASGSGSAPSQFPFGDDGARRAEVIDLTNDREPHSFHHYVLSLDIRSLLLRAAKGSSTQCYVRYHYPFLGTTVPFRSRPPTVVRPGTSATVGGGYASYHFAANSDMVEAAFTEVPLSVDVVSIDGHTERLLGTADFSLSPVLSCPTSTFVQDGSRKLGSRRVRTSKASLLDTRRSLVGELEAVICLDDLGVTVVPPATPLQGDRTRLPQVPATPGAEGTAAYEREIFKIMTELELWKEQQEILFRSRLKEKEDAHLKAISEEWKKHDLEREAALKKRFGQQKSDFQFLKGRLQKETKDTIKRSLQEYEHLLSLEKKKVADLEAEQQRLRNQVSKLEKALLTAESSQRDRFAKEVQLQRDYEKLLSDKVEMLKDLHEALQQKHKFSEELQKTRSRLADCEEALRRSERQHGVQAHHDEVEALYRRAKARFELQRLEASTAPSAPSSAVTSGQGTSRPGTATE